MIEGRARALVSILSVHNLSKEPVHALRPPVHWQAASGSLKRRYCEAILSRARMRPPNDMGVINSVWNSSGSTGNLWTAAFLLWKSSSVICPQWQEFPFENRWDSACNCTVVFAQQNSQLPLAGLHIPSTCSLHLIMINTGSCCDCSPVFLCYFTLVMCTCCSHICGDVPCLLCWAGASRRCSPLNSAVIFRISDS